MFKRFSFTLLIAGLFTLSSAVYAQGQNPNESLKKHFNKMVEQVEGSKNADAKRDIINESLNKLISSISRVEGMERVPESDKATLIEFRKDLMEKQNELNGLGGFARIPNNQLNNYANFIQQDFEQADKVISISITTLLLIILILLLI